MQLFKLFSYIFTVLLFLNLKLMELSSTLIFLKQFPTFSHLSNRQYGFRKEHSTVDLLASLTASPSSSIYHSSETFAVASDISKALDRVLPKALLRKLPSFGFFPSLF